MVLYTPRFSGHVAIFLSRLIECIHFIVKLKLYQFIQLMVVYVYYYFSNYLYLFFSIPVITLLV